MATFEGESSQARAETKNIIVAGCAFTKPNFFVDIYRGFSAEGTIRGIVTKAGSPFVDMPRVYREFLLYADDNDCWPHGHIQLHIELRACGEILVIAPADANIFVNVRKFCDCGPIGGALT